MSHGVSRILLVACLAIVSATAVNGAVKFVDIAYSYADQPESGSIALHYTNRTKKTICLGPDNWPKNGAMLSNGASVYVAIGDQRFYLKKAQDFCPKCEIKLKKNESSNDFIKYDSFGIPDSLRNATKTLVFKPVGYRC